VVIATHHKGDYAALRRILHSEAAYIGLVASRRRAALVLGRLRGEGFAPACLARVRAPAGLSIGSQTPQEIALSIVAEMVSLRRLGTSGARCARVEQGDIVKDDAHDKP
jgi:xanthine dehydrogenase accessory factor